MRPAVHGAALADLERVLEQAMTSTGMSLVEARRLLAAYVADDDSPAPAHSGAGASVLAALRSFSLPQQ